MLNFIIGLFIGTFLGVFGISLCESNKDENNKQ